ncbi:unnamed protein product [Closterium sp. Yama58-4]|nr:unnamed protein product [Closterium sp. Yama58-4]
MRETDLAVTTGHSRREGYKLMGRDLHPSVAMARKRKTVADIATECPGDLNEIPVASSRVVDDNAYGNDDDDSDFNEYAEGTDDEADSGEEEDKGMFESEDEADGDDTEGDDDEAPEETQPEAPTTRLGCTKPASAVNTTAKGGEPTRRASKTRNHIPVKCSVWSQLENTIFVALRNLVCIYKQLKQGEKASGKGAVANPPWFSYMELFQNNRVVANPHAVDGGGATHVNVLARFAVPCTSAPYTSTPMFTAPPTRNDVPANADTQPAMNTAEGGDDGWFRRTQSGNAAANSDADEDVWVRGDAE